MAAYLRSMFTTLSVSFSRYAVVKVAQKEDLSKQSVLLLQVPHRSYGHHLSSSRTPSKAKLCCRSLISPSLVQQPRRSCSRGPPPAHHAPTRLFPTLLARPLATGHRRSPRTPRPATAGGCCATMGHRGEDPHGPAATLFLHAASLPCWLLRTGRCGQCRC